MARPQSDRHSTSKKRADVLQVVGPGASPGEPGKDEADQPHFVVEGGAVAGDDVHNVVALQVTPGDAHQTQIKILVLHKVGIFGIVALQALAQGRFGRRWGHDYLTAICNEEMVLTPMSSTLCQ